MIPKRLKTKISKFKRMIRATKIAKKLKHSIFLKKLKKNTPVIVYQMGKVASSSIYSSLLKHYNGAVLHTHHFEPKTLLVNLFMENYAYKNEPIKLISLIREPISRNVSAFFQNFKKETGFEFHNHPYSLTELRDVFLEKSYHDYPLNWFDENILSKFNIDVYEQDFPNTGHLIIEKGNVSFLLMKHDLENERKEKVLSEFLNIESFKLVNKNLSSKKEYAQTYKTFNKAGMPDWYLEKMQNSRYMNHFYKDKKEKIINKWKKEN